jgi:hypothetical protein
MYPNPQFFPTFTFKIWFIKLSIDPLYLKCSFVIELGTNQSPADNTDRWLLAYTTNSSVFDVNFLNAG